MRRASWKHEMDTKARDSSAQRWGKLLISLAPVVGGVLLIRLLAASIPTAVCGSGVLSFSQHRHGTCSHNLGVDEWIRSRIAW
jgi:hypothetical protein